MPEGDTIHRTARTLTRAITGRVVRDFSSPLPHLREADVAGHTIRRVFARGKNLFIEFDDDRSLYSHMKMEGSWHVYRPGERWRVPRHRARVALETDEWTAVCFDAPVMELLTPFQIRGHPALRDLGPDLIADELDLDAVVRRFRRHDAEPIGVALMNQSIVAGIGNVYKSELLFIHRVDPFVPTSEVDDHTLKTLTKTAADLLKKNLRGSRRRTRFALDSAELWVYGRSGRPCLRCGETVRMRRQGAQQRSTYYCSNCHSGRFPG